jgi:hypothetical protein
VPSATEDRKLSQLRVIANTRRPAIDPSVMTGPHFVVTRPDREDSAS